MSERVAELTDARDFGFDREALLALAGRERRAYAEARPWPHLVLHDLVPAEVLRAARLEVEAVPAPSLRVRRGR